METIGYPVAAGHWVEVGEDGGTSFNSGHLAYAVSLYIVLAGARPAICWGHVTPHAPVFTVYLRCFGGRRVDPLPEQSWGHDHATLEPPSLKKKTKKKHAAQINV